MLRPLISIVAAALLLGLAPAAPAPKDAAKPIYFATAVGTKWVYFWDFTHYQDKEFEDVITSSTRRDGAWIVTISRDGKGSSFVWKVNEDECTLLESHHLSFVRVGTTAL